MNQRAYRGADRENQILRLAPLVRSEAARIARRLPPNVELDDLCSAGAVGLLHAVDSFDPNRGASIETFARQRIRGAILDELRRGDIVPRRMRARLSRIVRARRDLEREGVEATDEAVAQRAECSLEDVRSLEETVAGSGVVQLPNLDTFSTTRDSPDEAMTRHCLMVQTKEAVKKLAPREQDVLNLYYHQEQTYAKIGESLGVSESRVCQIHRQAVSKLRSLMQEPKRPAGGASMSTGAAL